MRKFFVSFLMMLFLAMSILAGCQNKTFAAETGNTPGNIANSGLAAEKDGWIYFVSGFPSYDIYKIRANGSEKT